MNRGSGWWGQPRRHSEAASRARMRSRSPRLGPSDRLTLAAIARDGQQIYHVNGQPRYVVVEGRKAEYEIKARDDYEAKTIVEQSSAKRTN